jgi:hypothetical protein
MTVVEWRAKPLSKAMRVVDQWSGDELIRCERHRFRDDFRQLSPH